MPVITCKEPYNDSRGQATEEMIETLYSIIVLLFSREPYFTSIPDPPVIVDAKPRDFGSFRLTVCGNSRRCKNQLESMKNPRRNKYLQRKGLCHLITYMKGSF